MATTPKVFLRILYRCSASSPRHFSDSAHKLTDMRSIECLKTFAFLFMLSLLYSACDVVDPKHSVEMPSIKYTVSGGFTGGTHTELIISSNGTATLKSSYPPLDLQLSDADHASLVSSFSDFKNLPDNFPNQCIDGLVFCIELQANDYSKHVVIDECTLDSQKDSIAAVSKINSLIAALESLAGRIYQTKASWIGLTADFSIDAEVYGLGEPITLRYVISNATSSARAIYFRHQSQFWFGLDRYNVPSFHYMYPVLLLSDSSAPSEIVLSPGEKKEITYVWNQRVQADGEDTAVGIGYYDLHMNLMAGELPIKVIWFEVLDRNVPIGGVITPDANGESSDSPSYTFALSVRNWTSAPVTLHFPSSQTIGVELYDLDKPTPGRLLYAGPKVTDSVASIVMLAPGEVRTFTHIASKSDFIPWYMWTYARIRLLCSDFTFTRDGQLRIFAHH